VDLVREVIAAERPDTVCIELDSQRFEALRDEKRWESLDLREIIRNRQLAQLIASLTLSSYQRRLGLQLGVTPGSELLEAARAAEELQIPIELCDRDVRITLRRAWAAVSWWRKAMLLATIAASAFDTPELSEEELRRIRQRDVLSELMRELGDAMPALKKVLIDERDAFLAEKIRRVPGSRIVAVVGAGHVEGMLAALEDARDVDLEEINQIPSVSSGWKWFGWGIPALILGSITWIGITRGAEAAGSNALYWFLANAIPTGVGGILALAHPATIAGAALAAPFTSLTPLIGAGYVAAFLQAWSCPPTVRDFQTVGDDLSRWRRWWSSRLLRIFLVFLLTTLGSVVGTWVGGVEVVSNLF
jgi:pheromone shutdown-related protein TraB